MKPKVFVCQPIPEGPLEMMREYADLEIYPYMDRMVSVDELIEAAIRSDYVYLMHETTVNEAVITANPNLKAFVGNPNAPTTDKEAADRHGIPFVHGAFQRPVRVPGVGGGPMPDLNMAMILNLGHRILEADRYVRGIGFRQEHTNDLVGTGVYGKTLGFIGLGRIGTGMLPSAHAFGMKTIYTKRTRLSPEEEAEMGVEWRETKEDILKESDFVELVVNYNPSTDKLIGEKEFKLMKPTAFFINTGRGRLIDEPALIKALQDKTIAGAGLDVFCDEPPNTVHTASPEEYRHMENVVLTPHNGGATWDSRTRQFTNMAIALIEHIKANQPAMAAV
jgi:glyoxylate reductase